MSEKSTSHWRAKLAAWTHDPPEKALILMRTSEGHEGGTVRDLQGELFPAGIPEALKDHIRRADHWASAADRPQFPQQQGNSHAAWTQVRFDQRPVLIHPLSGEVYDLKKLPDIEPAEIRALSTKHFRGLIVRDASGQIDHRLTALSFWRFGPDAPDPKIGKLWRVLPADTRIPDHTIWSHLDLTGAFAGAFALDADANPALLAVSFGPVQDFIAASRSTSDLWAGSHLLSCIAWEGMKVICRQIGPDALIFPQLRGVPLVDLWLQEQGLPPERFTDEQWRRGGTDANPLFAAALPNKLVAIVPADRAAQLAREITESVRTFVRCEAEVCLKLLLDAAGETDSPDLHCHTQLRDQLAGFPEVHWAAVPFAPLIRGDRESIDASELQTAQTPFIGSDGGFLGSEAWKLLRKEINVDGGFFYHPNPGVLYSAIYDLLDRVASAAKSVRPFTQKEQLGFRCSLTGESEWLTTEVEQLKLPPGQRKNTLWTRGAGRFGIKKGEHLGALSMLKRLWPKRFTDSIKGAIPELQGLQRYVVSTHTMALATSLERWVDGDEPVPGSIAAHLTNLESVALPRRLAIRAHSLDKSRRDFLYKLPSLLDRLSEEEETGDLNSGELRREISKTLDSRPEAYYALIQMDGDWMGAWIAGATGFTCSYGQTWHPQIRESVKNRFPQLEKYLATQRPNSPARHAAISAALNDFALYLARYIVEDLCKGKLIYAGGDDVLAMVSVDDLLGAMLLLRLGYSGIFPNDEETTNQLWEALGIRPDNKFQLGGDHARLDGRLLRLMGRRATASMGAVIAHHQAPLGAVLRRLRNAETRAKNAGRDAFAIEVLKRGGGAIELTLPWQGDQEQWWSNPCSSPMGVLLDLRNEFAKPDFSRRAAYHVQHWIEQLPPSDNLPTSAYTALLELTLAYQFERQGGARALGQRLGKLVTDLKSRGKVDDIAATVRDALGVAEFLAREGRVRQGKVT